MTVLFGSVEYFEQEIRMGAAHEDISMSYSVLKSELLNDFVCAESIRMECLENLTQAFCKLSKSDMCVAVK